MKYTSTLSQSSFNTCFLRSKTLPSPGSVTAADSVQPKHATTSATLSHALIEPPPYIPVPPLPLQTRTRQKDLPALISPPQRPNPPSELLHFQMGASVATTRVQCGQHMTPQRNPGYSSAASQQQQQGLLAHETVSRWTLINKHNAWKLCAPVPNCHSFSAAQTKWRLRPSSAPYNSAVLSIASFRLGWNYGPI